MLIIFGSGNHWISRTIKRSTNSIWTHCGPIDEEDNQVIESLGPPVREWLKHSLLGIAYKKPYGVVKTPLNDFIARYPLVDIRQTDGDINIARARIGMPFDFIGLICAYIKLNYHDPLKDFCTETTANAMKCIYNYLAHHQTPGSIYCLCEPLPDNHPYKVLVNNG
jgi:hypothetical protein